MAFARKFVSIQAIAQDRKITLFAVADDGTAWSRSGGISDHWAPYDSTEWEQIPSLPPSEARPAPKLTP